jgi:hypothetical protein
LGRQRPGGVETCAVSSTNVYLHADMTIKQRALLIAGGGDEVAQQLQLRPDGAAVGLRLGGHPRI